MSILAKPAAVVFEWDYDDAELLADRVVHAVGVFLGLLGTGALVLICLPRAAGTLMHFSALIYSGALMATLFASSAYNIWPLSRTKWVLRRLDHSTIYLLIAATYTPFLTRIQGHLPGLLYVIWAVAIIGMVLKLLLPGRLERFAIALYLVLGWSGILVFNELAAVLPASVLWLIAIGGLLFSGGVVVHLLNRLRFHTALWHVFVLAAMGCHYAAVVECVLLGAPRMP